MACLSPAHISGSTSPIRPTIFPGNPHPSGTNTSRHFCHLVCRSRGFIQYNGSVKTMADVFLFLRQGWNNIWKQNTIWLFGALPIFHQLFIAFQIEPGQNLSGSLLSLVEVLISTILSLVSFMGVPYLAYCFSIGRSSTVQETLFAIRKFSGRVIGCSCLVFLILVPYLFLAFTISTNTSTQQLELSNQFTLILFPLSIFSAMVDFSFFGFFANDSGIRKNLKAAWELFTAHFGVLAMLGIILGIMFRIFSTAAGISTLLIQSGFDLTSLSKLDYINPSMTLSRNILFVLINWPGSNYFYCIWCVHFCCGVFKIQRGEDAKAILIFQIGG